MSDGPPRGVALWGFMGAGKTSLGRVLAPRLGLPLVDLDARVEAEAGLDIPTLFAREGEAAFRAREARALALTLAEGPSVLACGGGTPARPGAAEAMAAWGLTVFLDLPFEALARRVGEGRGRPRWGPEAEALYAARRPVYARAHLTLDARGTPDQLAEQVASAWSARP